MVTPQVIRRWIMTGAVTAIAATGALYGAGLRTRQQVQQEKQKRQEATPSDMIAQLQVVRADLVTKKTGLERKIADFKKQSLQREQEKNAK